MTVLSTLMTALAWPATLLALTDFIDSRWTIAIDRFFFSLDCGKGINDENFRCCICHIDISAGMGYFDSLIMFS